MSYGVKLKVWGDYACFTRPEMKVERVSYDVMTPSAARGILEAIYWKPAIVWIIDRIHVLNKIRFDNVRRNELASKIAVGTVNAAMKDGKSPVEVFIEDDRQQRAAMILRDAAYVIEAHFGLSLDLANLPPEASSARRSAVSTSELATPTLNTKGPKRSVSTLRERSFMSLLCARRCPAQ